MAIDGKYAGHIVISDVVKPHSREAVQASEKGGRPQRRLCLPEMPQKVADQVAETLGLDEVYSELLPADKVEKVEELICKETGESKACLCRRRHQ